jgi:hypothetical protein
MSMRLVLAAIALLSLAGCASRGAVSSSGNWISLFDGRTLQGWTPKIRGSAFGVNDRDTFRVRDGALVVSYDKYDLFEERFGHLFYRTPYSSFRLRLEYRFVGEALPDTPGWAISNSGVMIFSQDPRSMTADQSFPVSVEAQLLGTSPSEPRRTTGNVCTPGTNIILNDVLTTTHCINASSPVTPNGSWTAFEIEVSPSGEVIQRINGAEVMRYSGVQLDPEAKMADSRPLIAAARGKLELSGGYIALQSEGFPVEFRNIQIQPPKGS